MGFKEKKIQKYIKKNDPLSFIKKYNKYSNEDKKTLINYLKTHFCDFSIEIYKYALDHDYFLLGNDIHSSLQFMIDNIEDDAFLKRIYDKFEEKELRSAVEVRRIFLVETSRDREKVVSILLDLRCINIELSSFEEIRTSQSDLETIRTHSQMQSLRKQSESLLVKLLKKKADKETLYNLLIDLEYYKPDREDLEIFSNVLLLELLKSNKTDLIKPVISELTKRLTDEMDSDLLVDVLIHAPSLDATNWVAKVKEDSNLKKLIECAKNGFVRVEAAKLLNDVEALIEFAKDNELREGVLNFLSNIPEVSVDQSVPVKTCSRCDGDGKVEARDGYIYDCGVCNGDGKDYTSAIVTTIEYRGKVFQL